MLLNTLSKRIIIGYLFMFFVLACAALTTLWKLHSITETAKQVREVNVPITTHSLKILKGINQSLASLRGWIVLGDKRFLTERELVWRTVINNNQQALKRLTQHLARNEKKDIFKKFDQQLAAFEKLQREIAAIAHTPENIPAQQLFDTSISSTIQLVSKYITSIIDAERHQVATPARKRLLGFMANFRGSNSSAFSYLQAYLFSAHDHDLEYFYTQWKRNKQAFQMLQKNMSLLTTDQLSDFHQLKKVRLAILQSIHKVIQLRQNKDWNKAHDLLNNQATTLENKLRMTLEKIVHNEELIMNRTFSNNSTQIQWLNQLSWVLLLGGLLACWLIAYAIIRSVITPIRKTIHVANEVAEGVLHTTIDLTGASEVEQLGQALTRMKKHLLDAEDKAKQALESFKANEKKTKAIVNNAVDGIITMNTRGIVQSFNMGAEKLFGYLSSEVIGNNIKMLMPNPYRDQHDDYLKNYKKTKKTSIIGSSRELSGKNKDGKTFPIQLSVSEVSISNETLYIGLVRDISREKQAKEQLQTRNQELEEQNWLRHSRESLYECMRGETNLQIFADKVIHFLCQHLDLNIGTFFHIEENELKLLASYAYHQRKELANTFQLGEGLVGQCALEKKSLSIHNLPDTYLKISSSLGNCTPTIVTALPLLFEHEVKGVIELGLVNDLPALHQQYIEQSMQDIGIAFNIVQSGEKLQNLLDTTRQQAHDLQASQSQLRDNNEELENQKRSLETSQTQLQQQQEELQATNEELEEKTQALQNEKISIENKNKQVEQAKQALETKAEELAMVSKYKSEFLANMSHELRTPLNSLLILSGLLKENRDNNLTTDQLESLAVISDSGNDLLSIINDILDLSKVEAGELKIYIEPTPLNDIIDPIIKQFKPIAFDKEVDFSLQIADKAPNMINTDAQRVKQIIKNILSNAFKFTAQGSVALNIDLSSNKEVVFSITDTGIGIRKDKQRAIFEAFQQVDGSDRRQYGGTGLGLTICVQLAKKLKGRIELSSEEGQGSTFNLYLPQDAELSNIETATQSSHQAQNMPTPINLSPNNMKSPSQASDKNNLFIADDRKTITGQDQVVLIIEDDKKFAEVLRNIAHKKGLKCLLTDHAKEGLALAIDYQPAAIILDLNLADMQGYDIVRMLKNENRIDQIPIHIISANDAEPRQLYQKTASHLTKPVTLDDLNQVFCDINTLYSKKLKTILLIEDDSASQKVITKLLDDQDLHITTTGLVSDACKIIDKQDFDCIILDLSLPDRDGSELLSHLEKSGKQNIPTIVYTGKELIEEEHKCLHRHTDSIILKGAASSGRLLDEVNLFLHQVNKQQTDRNETITTTVDSKNLSTKTMMLIDDNMRNNYALSKCLRQHNLNVIMVENGNTALRKLQEQQTIHAILVDMMMPEMNGVTTIKKIREQSHLQEVPIIAISSKAEENEHEDCLAAGANDYLIKPLQIEKLISLLSIWLNK